MKSRIFAKNQREVIVIAHNIRSIFNVGSIFRTAEGFGVKKIFLSGYTPNLEYSTDGSFARLLPHVREKLHRELHKTALGAEEKVASEFNKDVFKTIQKLREEKYLIVALEQNEKSINLADFSRDFPYNKFAKIALILGEEVHGISPEIMSVADVFVEIPMFGEKESFNVSISAGIALYEFSARL